LRKKFRYLSIWYECC